MLHKKDFYYKKYSTEVGNIILIDEWIAHATENIDANIENTSLDILNLSAHAILELEMEDEMKCLLYFLFDEHFRKAHLHKIQNQIVKNYFTNIYDRVFFSYNGPRYKLEMCTVILPYVSTSLTLKELDDLKIDIHMMIRFLRSQHALYNWIKLFECKLCPDFQRLFEQYRLRSILA